MKELSLNKKGVNTGQHTGASVPELYHPVYMTDELIRNVKMFYEEAEGCTAECRHWVSLGGEYLTFEDEQGNGQELHMAIYNKTRLVVRRVHLKNRRLGIFTHIVRMFLDGLKGTSVDIVEVESVLTPEMISWCRKYAFEEIPGMSYDIGGLGGSYRIGVTQLRGRLQ